MRRHRTTARALLLLAAAGLTAGTANARPEPLPKPSPKKPTRPAQPPPATSAPRLIFPVVGAATYSDDFGDARGSRRHEGNDIMAPRRTPVVAVEAGVVKLHTTSARAGCMLYLHGKSGTEYLYVHLNNDLTSTNDNTGRCTGGVAFAQGLRSGAAVAAGALIGYVGDSGDANGGSPHLHFEVHPRGGAAVNPYPYLRRARKALIAVQPGKPFTAALRGKVVDSDIGRLTLNVDQVRFWPGGIKVPKVGRKVALTVPPTTVLTNPLGALLAAVSLDALPTGQPAVAWTAKAKATLRAQLGEPLALATERLVLTQ